MRLVCRLLAAWLVTGVLLASCVAVSAQTQCGSPGLVCDVNAQCTHPSVTRPRYKCECLAGFHGSGTHCENTNECLLPGVGGVLGCHGGATCVDTVGSYACVCRQGFTGDGQWCSDVDECMPGLQFCDSDATCMNTNGGFQCVCIPGVTTNVSNCFPPNPGPMNGSTQNPTSTVFGYWREVTFASLAACLVIAYTAFMFATGRATMMPKLFTKPRPRSIPVPQEADRHQDSEWSNGTGAHAQETFDNHPSRGPRFEQYRQITATPVPEVETFPGDPIPSLYKVVNNAWMAGDDQLSNDRKPTLSSRWLKRSDTGSTNGVAADTSQTEPDYGKDFLCSPVDDDVFCELDTNEVLHPLPKSVSMPSAAPPMRSVSEAQVPSLGRCLDTYLPPPPGMQPLSSKAVSESILSTSAAAATRHRLRSALLVSTTDDDEDGDRNGFFFGDDDGNNARHHHLSHDDTQPPSPCSVRRKATQSPSPCSVRRKATQSRSAPSVVSRCASPLPTLTPPQSVCRSPFGRLMQPSSTVTLTNENADGIDGDSLGGYSDDFDFGGGVINRGLPSTTNILYHKHLRLMRQEDSLQAVDSRSDEHESDCEVAGRNRAPLTAFPTTTTTSWHCGVAVPSYSTVFEVRSRRNSGSGTRVPPYTEVTSKGGGGSTDKDLYHAVRTRSFSKQILDWYCRGGGSGNRRAASVAQPFGKTTTMFEPTEPCYESTSRLHESDQSGTVYSSPVTVPEELSLYESLRHVDACLESHVQHGRATADVDEQKTVAEFEFCRHLSLASRRETYYVEVMSDEDSHSGGNDVVHRGGLSQQVTMLDGSSFEDSLPTLASKSLARSPHSVEGIGERGSALGSFSSSLFQSQESNLSTDVSISSATDSRDHCSCSATTMLSTVFASMRHLSNPHGPSCPLALSVSDIMGTMTDSVMYSNRSEMALDQHAGRTGFADMAARPACMSSLSSSESRPSADVPRAMLLPELSSRARGCRAGFTNGISSAHAGSPLCCPASGPVPNRDSLIQLSSSATTGNVGSVPPPHLPMHAHQWLQRVAPLDMLVAGSGSTDSSMVALLPDNGDQGCGTPDTVHDSPASSSPSDRDQPPEQSVREKYNKVSVSTMCRLDSYESLERAGRFHLPPESEVPEDPSHRSRASTDVSHALSVTSQATAQSRRAIRRKPNASLRALQSRYFGGGRRDYEVNATKPSVATAKGPLPKSADEPLDSHTSRLKKRWQTARRRLVLTLPLAPANSATMFLPAGGSSPDVGVTTSDSLTLTPTKSAMEWRPSVSPQDIAMLLASYSSDLRAKRSKTSMTSVDFYQLGGCEGGGDRGGCGGGEDRGGCGGVDDSGCSSTRINSNNKSLSLESWNQHSVCSVDGLEDSTDYEA